MLVAVLGGCGKRINPAWCQQPENQSVTECGNIADAKVQSTACSDNDSCAQANPDMPYCDMGICVQCTTASQCPMNLPACTMNMCSACTQNSDCSTDFCDQGVCANPQDAIIVSPTGTGTQCGIAPNDPTMKVVPCDLLTGIGQAIANGKILRLVPDSSGSKFSPTATVKLPGNIRITGEGTVIDGSQANPTFQITSGQDAFDNLSFDNMSGTAIACMSGSLTAKRIYIHDGRTSNDPAFTSMPNCTIALDESVIYKAQHGALDIAAGDDTGFLIHNSVFASNSGGPAVVLSGKGVFEYNTVVNNSAPTSTGGVTCSGEQTLDMNILANNDVDMPTTPAVAPVGPPKDAGAPPPPPPPQQVGCDMTIVHGYTGYKAELWFEWEVSLSTPSAWDAWHLTEASPTDVVNIPNVTCDDPANPKHDIDDTARPAHNRCDMGADECATCTQTSNQGHQ